MSADLVGVAPTHDGEPMAHKGTRYEWSGDYSITTHRYVCDCGLTCEVVIRHMDGGLKTADARQRATT